MHNRGVNSVLCAMLQSSDAGIEANWGQISSETMPQMLLSWQALTLLIQGSRHALQLVNYKLAITASICA